MLFIGSPECATCSSAIENGVLCHSCRRALLSAALYRDRLGTYSAFRYTPSVRHLILRAKVQGDLRVARELCHLATKILAERFEERSWDYIIPIPAGIFRTSKRGFHLPMLFAETISRMHRFRELSWKERSLLRWRNALRVPKQSKNSRNERSSGQTPQFRLTGNPQESTHSTILLVDDVMTTGNTLDAATRIVQRMRPTLVERVTIAQTG